MDPLGRFQSLIESSISLNELSAVDRLIKHYKYSENLSDILLKYIENKQTKKHKKFKTTQPFNRMMNEF
jgi:hypothetical protein